MASGKAPGQDGLTSNLFTFFWDDLLDLKLLDLLFMALKECTDNNNLMSTMKLGIVTLSPKPGKDKRLIDNLRPITLLNVHHKIFTHIIANRLLVKTSGDLSKKDPFIITLGWFLTDLIIII